MKPFATLFILALTLGCACASFAENAAPSGDSVFDAEETVVPSDTGAQNAAPTKDVLTTEAPRLTGSVTAQAGVSGTWNTVWTGAFDPLAASSYGLAPQLGLHLGFSAKPDTDLGFYGEVRTAYPFTSSTKVFVPDPSFPNDPSKAVPGTITSFDLALFKLYAKYNWADTLFFVFGKQPVKWGTGYFFTPADDILSLTGVDLEDPTAEREGPLALKMQFPIPGTMSNLYLFAIFPSASMKPEEIALAPKAEIQFGNTEIAFAGYYQKDRKPQAVAMGTTGWGDFNVFGEAAVSFGSDRTFVVKRDAPVSVTAGPLSVQFLYGTRKLADYEPVFTGTLGGMYRNADWNMTLIAQYLYNGAGYSDLNGNDLVAAFVERANPLYPDKSDPTLGAYDLFLGGRLGQQYLVASVSWTEIMNAKLGFSVMSTMNLSDLSGFVKPTLSWEPFPRMSLSASGTFTFGADGSELVDPAGTAKKIPGSPSYDAGYTAAPTMTLALNLTLGAGTF